MSGDEREAEIQECERRIVLELVDLYNLIERSPRTETEFEIVKRVRSLRAARDRRIAKR